MTSDEAYLTTKQAAERLRTSPETVRRWVRDGKLAAITYPSGRRKFRPQDVDAILTPSVVE